MQEAWGLTIRDGYGQTETTLQIGNFPGQPVKPGAMGQAAPGYRIRLLDADDREQDGGRGLHRARSAAARADARLPERRRRVRAAGGAWPIAPATSRRATPTGYFTYVGRADDVFKASDYRISPFELESALIEHPAVAEAAVVPAPDPMRLAVPKAYVALARGHAPDRATALSIFRHLRDAWRRSSGCAGWSSPNCRRRSPARIRRVELRAAEAAAPRRQRSAAPPNSGKRISRAALRTARRAC